MEERKPNEIPPEPGDQSTPQLVRSIASDTGTLVRKEIELAKQEIAEGLKAKIAGAAAFGAAWAVLRLAELKQLRRMNRALVAAR